MKIYVIYDKLTGSILNSRTKPISALGDIVSSMVTGWPWVTYRIHGSSYSFDDERRQPNEHDRITYKLDK